MNLDINHTKIAIIGAGSWGSALGTVVSGKGYETRIWARNKEQIKELQETKVNSKYLPGITFNQHVTFYDDMKEALQDAHIILFSVPTQSFRGTLEQAKPFIKPETIVINVAKGIEQGTLKRLSQVAEEVIPGIKYVVLSGPSHAEEVALKLPTVVAVASENYEIAKFIQDLFITDRFRTYLNDDVVGVEMGGALKNIIALDAGISDGLGYGDNAKAALMTRGLTEITRLGMALGAKQETFAGLTGMGDLIVTCTSMHSRNRRCGIMIGEGMTIEEATKEIGMVVESITTTTAAFELAQSLGVETPIIEKTYEIIKGITKPQYAVEELMGRESKHEKI